METKRLISFGSQFGKKKEEIVNNLKVSRYGKYLQRAEIEQDVFEKIQNENSITLIYGNGGVGKSAMTYNVMSEIAQGSKTFECEVDKVFWFSDADHPGELNVNKVINEIKFACDVGVSSKVYSSVEEEIAEIDKLFDRDKLSFIVIDNFETVTDGDLIDFLLYNSPRGCKIVLTSKYPLRHFIDVGVISDRLEDCINEIFVPKFTYDEWLIVFGDKRSNTASVDNWASKISQMQEGALDSILKTVYERLGGNIFGMLSAVSQIAKRQIYDLKEIQQLFSEEELFKTAFNRILSDSWQLLSEPAQAVLLATMFNGTEYADMDFVCRVSGVEGFCDKKVKFGSTIDKAICECMDLNFMESDFVNGKNVYFLESLVYHFVFLKFKNGELENHKLVVERWISSYVETAKNIGFCYNDTAKMQVFDPPVKRNSLMLILNYLFNHERYLEFVEISKNLRYFFYTRAIWVTGDACIHIQRATACKKLGNLQEEFEALIYYINIASKYKQHEGIQKYICRTEEINKTTEISKEAYFRYKHVLGLYYLSCKMYDNALAQWNEILGSEKSYTNNIHDIDAAKRWRLKCSLEYGKVSPHEIISYCEDLLKDACSHNFERGVVDCSLMLANQYLKINDKSTAKHYLLNIADLIAKVNDLLYSARYHQYLAFCYGEDGSGEFHIREAVELYKELNVESETEKFKKRILDAGIFTFILEELKGEGA